MIFRIRLDISWTDVAFGGAGCLLPARRTSLQSRIQDAFPDGEEALVCLSVRTGFDLLLATLALPKGSEVLMSAITVPDMSRIVREHGLVPVPVDLDPTTLAPLSRSLEAAMSDRSRVLVMAHLFGGVADFSEARAFARGNGLVFVEDCAQSFIPGRFWGAPDSDVRMLSFGPIKTQTALGGAVVFVADADLRARMAKRQDQYPMQSRRAFLRRWLKYGIFRAFHEPLFSVFRAGCRVAGVDIDDILRDLGRSFRGKDLLAHLRRRPSTALLRLLARRLGQPAPRVAARTRAAAEIDEQLSPRIERPGTGAHPHTHWLYPICTEDPARLMMDLRDWGFDATGGASSLTSLAAPLERPEIEAPGARDLVRRILFLPAYPEMGRSARRRLAQALNSLLADGNEAARTPQAAVRAGSP